MPPPLVIAHLGSHPAAAEPREPFDEDPDVPVEVDRFALSRVASASPVVWFGGMGPRAVISEAHHPGPPVLGEVIAVDGTVADTPVVLLPPVYLRRGATPGEDVGSLDPAAGELVGHLLPIAGNGAAAGRAMAEGFAEGFAPILRIDPEGRLWDRDGVQVGVERPPFATDPEPRPDATRPQGR